MHGVLHNIARLLTCQAAGGQGELHPIEGAALAWRDGRIAWVGNEAELPAACAGWPRHDARGALVLPGLIDCHTHLAFAGDRSDEFERRLLGASYLEIARAGGGIRRTVAATRAASDQALADGARRCAQRMLRRGTTTIECKSGYGLALEHELRLLEVYRRLGEEGPQRFVATLLGAHVVGPEHQDDRTGYVRMVCDQMIPQAAATGLARFCDVFVEETAFSADEARVIVRRAAEFGLGAKLHVDQLSDQRGGELAEELRAVSADHLEHVSTAGIAALARAGTVAVSLPFASFFLRQPALPARALIAAGVPVAVATDYNPGSAPCDDLPLALLLATVLQGMSAAEAIKGATLYAARALGLEHELGSLEVGKAADFVLLDAVSERAWLFHRRDDRTAAVWIGGRCVFAPGEPA